MNSTESKKRCALYLRVSGGPGQTTDNQRPELLQLARARGLDIVAVYDEVGSAVKQRAAYDKMTLAAHRGEFDVLLVWSLDRFGRSMVGNLQAVLDLDHVGVQVVSVREPWLDTSSPVRSLLVAIFSWVAGARAPPPDREDQGRARPCPPRWEEDRQAPGHRRSGRGSGSPSAGAVAGGGSQEARDREEHPPPRPPQTYDGFDDDPESVPFERLRRDRSSGHLRASEGRVITVPQPNGFDTWLPPRADTFRQACRGSTQQGTPRHEPSPHPAGALAPCSSSGSCT